MVAHWQREIVCKSSEVTFDSCPPDGPDELAEACAGFGMTSPRRMCHAGREDLLASSLTMTETAEQYVTPFARETFELQEERFWSTRWADIEILAGEKSPLTLRQHWTHGVRQHVWRWHAMLSRCWYQYPGLILFGF